MRHSLGSIGEPLIGKLLGYWRSACPYPDVIPHRRQIDPADMAPLLPHVALLDVLTEAPWVRCRLAGEEVERQFGCSLRGATLGSLRLGGQTDDIEEQYRSCIDERIPIYCSHRFVDLRGRPHRYHRLALPLSDEADNVSHLLLGFRFLPWTQDDALTPA